MEKTMKRKALSVLTAVTLTASMLVGCGSTATGEATQTAPTETTESEDTEEAAPAEEETTSADETVSDEAATGTSAYADLVLGTDNTDITTTIKWLTQRTDLIDSGAIADYIKAFNEMYPNITVEAEGVTNYADDSLLRLQTDDWGDIMMVPAIDKSEYPNKFLSYGDIPAVQAVVNYAIDKNYDGQVYGIPSTAVARGIVYNKAVFEKAGITTLPKTPEEFQTALQAIKDNTDAIPLYTNYAAEWTMGAWDDYVAGTATGDPTYMNQILLHSATPFADQGDGTHPYAVYKVLYDAVAAGLTEDDYTTTDWESSKTKINNGEIGCMVLGSWAYPQMVEAGDHGEDIGYMPFPITVNGKQYASAGPDYCYAINANASEDNQKAAMTFVKWMTEKSGFSYNEGGLPISKDGEFPEVYKAFEGIEYVADDPAVDGEEGIRDELNAESELNIAAGGNAKIMELIEHAANQDKDFDEIMDEWNTKWADAQSSVGVEAK